MRNRFPWVQPGAIWIIGILLAYIAPFLHVGKNIIAAQVWNEGEWRPKDRYHFVPVLYSGILIKKKKNNYRQLSGNAFAMSLIVPSGLTRQHYYVAGPGEQLDMNKYLADWKKLDFPDGNWKNAEVIMPGIPKNLIGGYGTVGGWL